MKPTVKPKPIATTPQQGLFTDEAAGATTTQSGTCSVPAPPSLVNSVDVASLTQRVESKPQRVEALPQGVPKFKPVFDAALIQQISSLDADAQALTIVTADDVTKARDFLLNCKAIAQTVQTTSQPIKQELDKAHKAAVAEERKLLDPISMAEKTVQAKIAGYTRAEDERRLQAARDAQFKAEEEERARRAAEARQAKKNKQPDVAKAILAQPLQVAVAAPPPAPKVQGLVQRKTWKVNGIDESLLPRSFLMPDLKKIADVVRAMGEDHQIAGVTVVQDVTVSVRGPQ